MKRTLLFFFAVVFSILSYSQVIAYKPYDVFQCSDDSSYTFNLNYDDIIIGGQTDVFVRYYLNQSDAEFGNENRSIHQITVSQNATVYARVENYSTGEYATTSFSLNVIQNPFVTDEDFVSCDDETADGITTFYLNTGGGSSYYLTRSDAFNKINTLPNNYVNTTPYSQIIYERIDRGQCYNIGSHNLRVISVPNINQPTDLEVCDDSNNDGVETFDLLSKNNEIIGGATANLSITYHESLSDANSGSNTIISASSYSSFTSTIYARVEDVNTSCYSVTALNLVVRDCSANGIIKVNAFYDEDKNTIFDNDEVNFLNGVLNYVKNDDGVIRHLYSSNGVFYIISEDESDTYNMSYHLLSDFDLCYDVTTFSYENISVTNGNTVNYSFPITKIAECRDIAVYLVSNIPPRPGFDYKNYLVVENKGIETISSGTVEFTMDATLSLNGVTGVNAGNSVTNTANGFNLNFTNLQPNSYERVRLDMKVPIPTPLGTVLTNKAQYTGSDVNMDNNYTELSEVVIGSYDPNDILESHGPEIVHSSFTADDYLYYTVRFQNEGTADAINVSIDNTLDSRLDKSTIKMLSSSHDNVFTRIDNQLNWQFDNIHLPSEDMDEPNSHGYVYYKIKPTAGYSVGDIIPNTAEIYFDFNPAVITNTFETEFTTTLSVYSNVNTLFSMSPNPAHDFVELGFNKYIGNPKQISIYDIQGKLIKRVSNVAPSKVKLDVSQLDTGLYFLKVNSGVSEDIKKLIIR